MTMLIVKQPRPPERLRLPPVQPPHAVAPARVSPQPRRWSPASPRAAASRAGLRCRRRRQGPAPRTQPPARVRFRTGVGAGGRERGSQVPGGRAGRLRPSPPARPPAGVSARPAAGRRQSAVAGLVLHFLLGGFPCSFPEARRAPNPLHFLKYSLYLRQKPLPFQEGNVPLFEYDFL